MAARLVKNEIEESTRRLAVLIDSDNAQPAVIGDLLAEIARFGEATVKRIYGDFTSPTSTQWKKVLNKYAIKPMQQFAYTSGKMRRIVCSSSTQWISFIHDVLTVFAWYPVIVILPDLLYA